mgnify:CR=1 FL=1
MEELRGQGKVKTVTYQQHIAHKLMLQNLIDRMDIYEGQATGAKNKRYFKEKPGQLKQSACPGCLFE